jgi:Flp pilus assembly protein TadB
MAAPRTRVHSRKAVDENPWGDKMGILKGIGIVLLVTWVVLWLFVKITFAAVHLLFLIGIAMLVMGFVRRETSST